MNEINHLELELYKTAKRKVELIDIAKVINMKTKIPVYELLNNKLEITPTVNKLNKEIKGQEHAIKELVDVYKKIKLGFNDENKCYSILFCGPSGVGKTHLAKLFGSLLVSDRNVIKLDMSEF